jgi:3-hydroxyisobutyrate dehydrogenase
MRIGWVGLGIMGAPLVGHLLAAGHEVTVWSRRRESGEAALAAGAVWADSPAEVAAASEVTCTMVGFPADVREVVLGEQGTLAGAAAGDVLVDLTTSEPALAVEVAAAAAARGVGSVDAPVSGGDVGAREATLVVMCGGADEDVARARPVLEPLARTMQHLGGPGAGQHAKMTNQIAIASGMVAVCEALVYAERAGLDLEQVLATIGGGAAGSWTLSNLAPRAVRGDFAPGFKVDHFVKDLGIALAEARRMRLALPGLALAEQLYVAVQARGGGRQGTHALLLALRDLSATDQL